MTRRRSGEPVVFIAATTLDLVHALDDAFVQNGAAVVVVHGGSSDRNGSADHARMLARHGSGVLLYDARGRGESDGSENNYGWDWAKDIAGALAFVKAQDDEAARGQVEHWNMPEAHHTDAIREFAGEYDRRVVGFFAAALL
jgi:alpha/beta superfamily hydrolase